MSQQQLAVESEVSTRHISYVENGKSSPSRQMVLILASALDLPLRERNALLSCAGFAPVYRETRLTDPQMQHVRQALETILAHQEPYPAVVLTRGWDIVKMNDSAIRLFARLVDAGTDPIVTQNVMHAVFHPGGLRPYIANWEQVGCMLIDRLYRESVVEPERSETGRLLDALRKYPSVPSRLAQIDLTAAPQICITLQLQKDDLQLELFTTLTTLGTPMDVTVQELRIESYFPANDATAAWFQQMGAADGN